jgi:hypothetical protein
MAAHFWLLDCESWTRQTDLTRHQDEQRLVMITMLKSGASVIVKDISYFRYPKDLQLHKPTFTATVTKEGDACVLRLTSNTLAKNVCLSIERARQFEMGVFSQLPR